MHNSSLLKDGLVKLIQECDERGFTGAANICRAGDSSNNPDAWNAKFQDWAIVESLINLLEEPSPTTSEIELSAACAIVVGIIIFQQEVLTPVLGKLHKIVFAIKTRYDDRLFKIIESLILQCAMECRDQDVVVLRFMLSVFSAQWCNRQMSQLIAESRASASKYPWMIEDSTGVSRFAIGLLEDHISGKTQVEHLYLQTLNELQVLVEEVRQSVL